MTDWVPYNKYWPQFVNDGLVKPGVLIEIDEQVAGYPPESLLIGHVNDQGGECDHCCPRVGGHYNHGTMVLRYRTVWEGEQ